MARTAIKRTVVRSFNFAAAKRGYVKLSEGGFGDDAFERVYGRCRPFTMTSPERMFALYKALEYVVKADVPGDVVECGVWRGGSAMLAAETLLNFDDQARPLWLYDTFSGMTRPSEKDSPGTLEKWEQSQNGDHNDWCYASLDDVKRNMSSTVFPAARTRYVQGPVEETLPADIPEQIALLRLDTDWYESSLHELEHLYPRLSAGGVLLLDDYGHWDGQRQAVDEYFERTGEVLLLNRVDQGGRIAVKP